MTRNDPDGGDITTEAEFEAALDRLLDSATSNGLDPRGSWVYRNGKAAPDWEVMVLELQKEDATD
jgi:hypothetical protein